MDGKSTVSFLWVSIARSGATAAVTIDSTRLDSTRWNSFQLQLYVVALCVRTLFSRARQREHCPWGQFVRFNFHRNSIAWLFSRFPNRHQTDTRHAQDLHKVHARARFLCIRVSVYFTYSFRVAKAQRVKLGFDNSSHGLPSNNKPR